MGATNQKDKNVLSKVQLDELRGQIDAIDDEIACLIQARMALVSSAASLKSVSGEGAVSPVREKSILEHGAFLEQKYHLPASLMQDLQRRILRESYVQKGSGAYAQAHIYPATVSSDQIMVFDKAHTEHNFKVCIVGGKGAMGRFFARYLAAASYEVSIVDVDDYTVDLDGQSVSDIKLSKAAYYLSQAQWCIVSVPIDVTVAVINKVAPLLKSDCVLSDLTSVKSDIMQAMLGCHKGPVMGLHPMFGPDTFSLVKQVVVAVLGRDNERCAFIVEQLKLFGARVVECSAQEHDDAMRVIQALRHFTTIAYGNFLKESFGAKKDNSFIERLLELSSPIYRLELMMVGRLFAQDPRLYCEIISSSPKNFELIERYVTCAQQCLDKLKNDDKVGFVQDFNDTTQFFGEFAKLFLQESGAILALVQDTYHI